MISISVKTIWTTLLVAVLLFSVSMCFVFWPYPTLAGLIFLLVLSPFGFRQVPEEERWIIEIFGSYHRTIGPGLCWVIPFLAKVKGKHTWSTQQFQLFEDGTTQIDFKDGAGKPRKVFVFVRANISDPRAKPIQVSKPADPNAPAPTPDPCPDLELDDRWAIYKMQYATAANGLKASVVGLIENGIRSYLNSLTVEEAMPGGRSGFDIVEKIKSAANGVNDLNGIKRQLADWGLRLVRITVGDFDLDPAVIAEREKVLRAMKDKEAAVHEKKRRSDETAGVIIQQIAELYGITYEQAQAKLKRCPALAKKALEGAQTIFEDRIAAEKGTLIRSRGNLLAAVFMGNGGQPTLPVTSRVSGNQPSNPGGNQGQRGVQQGSGPQAPIRTEAELIKDAEDFHKKHGCWPGWDPQGRS